MSTKKQFGVSKGKGIALLVQLILTLLATASTVFILWFSVANQLGTLFTVSYAVVLLSYVAIFFYASYGYRKDDSYYLGAVYAFCAAILLNILLPFRNTFQVTVLVLLFGLYIAFAQRLHQKAADWLLVGMLAFALVFSVCSSFTAKVDTLGELSSNLWSVSAMYLSIWTPVIMTVTLALAYSVRKARGR